MTPASSAHQPAALARAFLALADGEPATPPRAVPPTVVVLLAAIVLAMSTPLLWAGLAADGPDGPDAAATTPHRIALVEGDDDGPGGP
jgi:hypothetical protein